MQEINKMYPAHTSHVLFGREATGIRRQGFMPVACCPTPVAPLTKKSPLSGSLYIKQYFNLMASPSP